MRLKTSFIALTLLVVALTPLGWIQPLRAYSADGHSDSSVSLKRADFRIVGASCAVCLREVERLLRENPGVVSSAVSFKAPYKAVVIYYPQKVSLQKMLSKLHQHSYSFADLEDKAVATVPAILLGAEDTSLPARSEPIDLPKPKSLMP